MADVVSREKRSRMMSGIQGKDTKPEMLVRKGLHALGFRYRLHDRNLPGRPDLVFPKYNAIIEVNGCFWHMHDCHLFKWPSTREEFWRSKLEGNRARDERNYETLREMGWRLLVIWECALKGKTSLSLDEVIDRTTSWLESDSKWMEIQGRPE